MVVVIYFTERQIQRAGEREREREKERESKDKSTLTTRE